MTAVVVCGLTAVSLTAAVASTRTSHAAAGSVLATTPVGSAPDGVAVDSTRHEAFVTSALASTLTVVSTVTGHVIATYQLPLPPLDVAVAPAVGRVFVSLGNTTARTTDVTLGVIAEQTGVLQRTLDVGVPADQLALDAATGQLVVTGDGYQEVSTVDVRTLAVGEHRLPAASYLGLDVAVDATTGTTYVTDGRGEYLLESPVGGDTFTPVRFPGFPLDIAADPTSGTEWVTLPAAGELVELRHGAVAGTVGAGSYPEAVAVDPGTGTVFVADFQSGAVSVIRESDRAALGAVAVGPGPLAMAVDTVARVLVVANSLGSSVTLITEPAAPASQAVTSTARTTATPTVTPTAGPTAARSAAPTDTAAAPSSTASRSILTSSGAPTHTPTAPRASRSSP